MKTLMIVDCNAVAHTVKHTSAVNLTYRGRRTGILFGFIKTLLTLQETIQADNWFFAWDSSNGYLRQKEYQPYKAKRAADKTEADKQLDELAYPQFNLLRSRLLDELGFRNVLQVPGFESDDLMAQVVCTHDYEHVMVTRDRDMYQCLGAHARMFDWTRNSYYTAADLAGQWGCEPADWAAALAIAGCDTDNVEGIPGVGVKTAIKFLNRQLNNKTQAYQKIANNEVVSDRNLELVCLPHWQTPAINIQQQNEVTVERMKSVARRNGMSSLLSAQFCARWEAAFCEQKPKG